MSPDEVGVGDVVVWAAGLSTVLSLATTIWTLVSAGSRRNAKAIVDIEGRLNIMDRLVQRHTDQIAQLPGIEMMHRMELSLKDLHGDIRQLDERLKPVAAIAERMQDLLIEQAQGSK